MSNISFSLDQMSNLVQQNEAVVKGMSEWFYSNDDYIVFSNKNHKTIDGLVEYDETAVDKEIYNDNIAYELGNVNDYLEFDSLIVNEEIIDTEYSYKCEYKITMSNIAEYNSIKLYDVVDLSDLYETNILKDLVVKEKLGNKTLIVYSNFFRKQANGVNVALLDRLSISDRCVLDTDSKLIYNLDEITDEISSKDLYSISGEKMYITDYVINDDKNIIILNDYATINVSSTTKTIIYVGDGDIIHPKLLYKDLIHFPTLNLYAKFKNINKPFLKSGANGELILDSDILMYTKIDNFNDENFHLYVKYPKVIFDINSYESLYDDLEDGYHKIYAKTVVKSSIYDLKFDLDIIVAPTSENYINLKYTQIGGVYIQNNVVQSYWDLNNKPNKTLEEIETIIYDNNVYPKKRNGYWYFSVPVSDINTIDITYSNLIKNFILPDINVAKLLDVDMIYKGTERIDGKKYYCFITNNSIYKYNSDELFLITGANIVCMI